MVHQPQQRRLSEELSASAPGGWGTLWPIANTLPAINSPFNIDTGTDCLSCYPDQTLANDLLPDNRCGVNFGFPWKRDSRIYEKHFSATTNPEAVAKQLERQLSRNCKTGPFHTPPFANLSDCRWALFLNSARCLQNGTSFTIYHCLPLTLLTTVFLKNCFLVLTTLLSMRSRNLTQRTRCIDE